MIMTELKNIFTCIILVPLLALSACQEKTLESSIELEKDEIIMSDSGAPVEVKFTSTTEWRIEYNLENGWLSTDLMGGRPSTGKFTVRGSANKGESMRIVKIRLFSLDGNESKEITVIQLSAYPSIVPDAYSMVLTAADATYKIPITANVQDEEISVKASQDWITNLRIEESVLKFDALPNDEESSRSCALELLCSDEFGRSGEAVIKLFQSAPSKYNGAIRSDILSVSSLQDGIVTDNVYVEGYVVVNGSSKNYDARRYILKDDSGNSIILESEDLIAMDVNCLARVALMDTRVETMSEGGFSYKVFKGMTIEHLLKAEESTWMAPVTEIGEIGDDDVFNVVTLKEVEIALAAGAYTNFKTCFAGTEAQKQSDYFVNLFPSLYRYYPVPVRDKAGHSMYMLTSLKAPWAHRTLPSGSGTLTGLIVKVNLKCFGITENDICIVPLFETDLKINEYDNTVSTIIAEWDCNAKISGSDPFGAIDPMTEYNPDGGLLKGNPGTILNKSGNTGFSRWYSNTVLGYQDSFRGDVNLSDADDQWYGTASNGYYGRVNGGAFNSKPWNDTQYFYIDGISTKGISGNLSLQVSMNVTKGVTTFVIEYAGNVTSDNWTKVEGSEFDLHPQFDRTDAARQTDANIPGYKFYTFALPADLSGQDNVCIRLRSVSSTMWEPVRLDHISLKYNN